MDKHVNAIDDISQLILKDLELLDTCDITNCLLLRKHFRDRNSGNRNENEHKTNNISSLV